MANYEEGQTSGTATIMMVFATIFVLVSIVLSYIELSELNNVQ